MKLTQIPDGGLRGETLLREAAEAQGVFVEAQDEKGLRWLIRVIRSGISGNKNFYGDSVLREAAPLFEGARVFVKSDDEHLAGKGKNFRNLIGRLTAPKFIEGRSPDTGELRAVLELLESAGEIPAKMREAWSRNMAKDLFGFSIDATGSAKTRDGIRVAQKFTKVHSVDLIIEPGAGGELINLIEAQSPQEGAMKELLQRMIEAIKKANQGNLPEGLDVENEEKLEAAYREAIGKDAQAAATAAAAASAATVDGTEREPKPVTQDDLRMVEARAHLRVAVTESKLPDLAKERVRKQFEGRVRFTEADVDQAIKDEREYLSKFTESGRVSGLGDSLRLEAGEQRSEKMVKMLDGFFAGEKGAPRSFKECYIAFTGDRNITGRLADCDRALLRESLGADFREALDSTSWANALGNSITRSMVREYNAAVEYDPWRQIVDVVPVRDFRSQERIRIGGYGDLPIVNQGQLYAALASPTDEKATYVIEKRGGTEEITMEMTANDDVGAIRRIPVKLGRSAKRTLAKFVFDFIRTNPVIFDGNTLFHAAHNNLGAAALDATSLAARRLAMLKQTELNSLDRLGVGPSHLLVALDAQESAVNLFNRNTNLDKTFVNAMSLNIIPVWYWTDANDWALAANPKDVPCLEVGFFNGNEEPELFVQDNPTVGSMFSHDKLTYKIRHIYGGAAHDFRGLDKSVVA